MICGLQGTAALKFVGKSVDIIRCVRSHCIKNNIVPPCNLFSLKINGIMDFAANQLKDQGLTCDLPAAINYVTLETFLNVRM